MAAVADQQQLFVTRVRDLATILLLVGKEIEDLNTQYGSQEYGTALAEKELTEPLPGNDGIKKDDVITFLSAVSPAVTNFIDTHKTTLNSLRNNRQTM